MREDSIRDYNILLQHLAMTQHRLSIDDPTLLDLLEEFSTVMIDISDNVQERGDGKGGGGDGDGGDGDGEHEHYQGKGDGSSKGKGNEKFYSPNLDDFDFGLGPEDIVFTT